ncbi:dihydroneopterin aldolase [Leptothrix discophora]|uniref:dihydroneopterin aldolase n=2 Tax=Leptothrix discophora TaxID=89 RepID=A0ABT9G8C7_LEPDI|nr:dihydroneopterin aldolase [Leptothrix discophora]MDP4302739.1 dihydroneopterin aldolase [Leptothrix discophora]
MPLHASMPEGDATAPALDLIFIEGYTGETVIGIHPSEFHRTQPLVIDVQAGLPRALACDSDHIADTIDYGVVRDRLDALMRDHGVTLLEALAERIAQMLLVDFGAAWVRVKVVKPRKFDNVQAVGVQIERRRAAGQAQRAAARAPQAGAQVLRWIGAGTVPQATPPRVADGDEGSWR